MILPPDEYTLVSETRAFKATIVTLRRRSTGARLGTAVQRDGESSWRVFDPVEHTLEVGRATSLRHAAAMLRHHARRQR